MDDVAIMAQDLSRNFGKFTAVDRVNFSIKYGEIFGFLGSNGAGKSTTIRMLCGILAPTGGTARVAGFDINKEPEEIKRSIGYVSQRFSLYTDLTVEENLRFYGTIYGLDDAAIQERIEEVLKLTGLESWRGRLASELSGGWKQKLALANAILHRPRILFLDEPTAGIDPISRRSLWELLYQIANSGVALFVTTHYMEEAERCNQIAFISRGRLLKIGTPQELKNSVEGKLLEVACSPLMKASHMFGQISGVVSITAYGTMLHLNVTDVEKVKADILRTAAAQGITVTSIEPIAPSLEDVFATLGESAGE
jgi:ABC-2 type transport system ATP-binding protein